MTIGFIGTGHMGEPMARNLLRAGIPLAVWNRTPGKCLGLVELGAEHATSLSDLFKRSSTVMLMLLDSWAIDDVLGRNTTAFAPRVRGRVTVNLGTTSPAYSAALARDIAAAGGSFVEAPVSGSRQPAEAGELIGMVAGAEEPVEWVMPLLDLLCARVVQCGTVPGALRMKLAANHYLIGMVTVLAETIHTARHAGVDLDTLQHVLDSGPMSSAVSRGKLAKLVAQDFSPQAAIHDVATIAALVLDQADAAGVDAPLMRISALLYERAKLAGHGAADMSAVVEAFAPRHPQPSP